ncbi:MAG: hypothetical protein ABI770_00105 [Sphingomicrobium sp.]
MSYTRTVSWAGAANAIPQQAPSTGLTRANALPYLAIRMKQQNAIAATSTAHLWWPGQSFAARWRD